MRQSRPDEHGVPLAHRPGFVDHRGHRPVPGFLPRPAHQPEATLDQLVEELLAQAARSSAVIAAHDLRDIGQPGERWSGADPASLERVLFHLVQEYARHIGQLDIVAELAGGETGE